MVVIQCSSLSPLRNGQITFSENRNAPFVYGTTATYSCSSGYIIAKDNNEPVRICGRNGTTCDNVRVCNGDGTSTVGEWSGESLVCVIEGDYFPTKMF